MMQFKETRHSERSLKKGERGGILTGWASSSPFVVEKYGEWAMKKRKQERSRQAESSPS